MKREIDWLKVGLLLTAILSGALFINSFINQKKKDSDYIKMALSLEKKAVKTFEESKLLEIERDSLLTKLQDLKLKKNAIDRKIKEVVIYKVIKDTASANDYLKERYGTNTIAISNDIIKGDVCQAKLKLTELAIHNRDSIITQCDSIVKRDSLIFSEKNNAFLTLKQSNSINKLNINELESEIKRKKKSVVWWKLVSFGTLIGYLLAK